jgi:hypothetical protein
MNRLENNVKRIFADTSLTFMDVINSIIDHKIEELVNNASKVNAATSQNDAKEYGSK